MATLSEAIYMLVGSGFNLQFSAGQLGETATLVIRMNRGQSSALDAVLEAEAAKRDEIVVDRLYRMRALVEGQERVKVLHDEYGGDPFN